MGSGNATVSSMQIADVSARRIWDSRGRPTVEAEVRLEGGAIGRGTAPAGASRGRREALELRDGGTALGGYGVDAALRGIRDEISPVLRGMGAGDQAGIDAAMIELDATPQKQRLGGNALIAVSLAVLNAAGTASGNPLWRHLAGDAPVRLPLPEIQIFGGGAHAGRRIDVQDLMVMPVGAASFDEALVMVAAIYRAAGALMAEQGRQHGVADEGGWWPDFASNEEALDMLVRAIEGAGFRPGEEAAISLDIAASEFGNGGRYRLGLDRRELDTDGMIALLGGWLDRFPIASIEDPLAEDDPEGMRRFTAKYGSRVQIIGDDYLVTNAALVEAAASARACNAVLIKPNQAGTVTETVAALAAARAAGFATIISARSGETEDVTLAHLAVGWNTGQLKVGSFARSERMAKWNEILRISEQAGEQATYAGRSALSSAA